MSKKPTQQDGYAIFLAVVITSILLMLTLGMSTLVTKEVKLSSYESDSDIALSAADSGLECTQYWDLHVEGSFPAPTPYSPTAPISTMFCNGQPIIFDGAHPDNFVTGSLSSPPIATHFKFLMNEPQGQLSPCVKVVITKQKTPSGGIHTTVESSGYNTCDVNNARQFERTIKTEYGAPL